MRGPFVLLTASPLVQVASELARTGGMPQLPECLALDLADALPGDAELAADLFERAGPAVDQPEPQLDDPALPLG
jgi:hypothetical protein